MEKNKKLIDLGILQDDEATGVKKISLVEEPAIMVDFMYFKKHMFVEPTGGETEDEFIGRCMSALQGEFPDQDQRYAVCQSYWKGEIDTSGLTPYVDPAVKKKNGKAEAPITKAIEMSEECPMDYSWMDDKYVVETLLKLAEELGTKEEDLKALFESEFKFANPSLGGTGTSVSEVVNQGDQKLYLYKYEGLITDNSRDFCVGMVSLDRFYTKAQIQAMSDIAVNRGFGIGGAATYSIWQFKGGPNCKHVWSQYLVTMPEGQIMIEYVKPAVGRAGTEPYNMPKHGYYSTLRFESDEKQVVVGPAMIPDINIPRLDDDGDKYFVKFTEDTIREIAMKYMKEARTIEVNTDHEENEAGAYVFESWLIEDPATDKANTKYGYNLPKGTWMVSMKVEDKATWNRIKMGNLKGFSVEGILVDMEEIEARKKYEQIKRILS